MAGMMRAYELTRERRYLELVRRCGDHHRERGIGPTLRERGDCGHWGPAYPTVLLYQATGEKRYLELAGEVAEYILAEAERTEDGGFSHFRGEPQLWVDTLPMCCPLLAALGRLETRVERRRKLEGEAARQCDCRTGGIHTCPGRAVSRSVAQESGRDGRS